MAPLPSYFNLLWENAFTFPFIIADFACTIALEKPTSTELAAYMKSKEWQKETIMFTILIVLALFIVLDIAALRWGRDSTERVDSCEWERRSYRHDDADNLAAC